MLCTTTASPTGRPLKPHARNIANDVAIPTAAPPGATDESALEARVAREARRYESPGSAATSGGPYVTRFSSAASASTTSHRHDTVCTTSQTSP